MSSPQRWLRAGILAVAIASVGVISLGYGLRAAAKERDALAAFSSSISLRMSRDEVNGRCEQACRERSGWRYHPHVPGFRTPVALVESPLEVGARNWVTYIVFENDAVAAVLVRAEDSQRLHPDQAPPDRVQNPAAPWLADFRPD